MIQYIGELIERVTTSVKQFGINPRSPVIVREGEFGPEMLVEHVKVRGGIGGPVIILEVRRPQ